MRLSWQIRAGLICLLFALGVYGAVFAWFQTRSWTLVQMPISLTPGRILTPEFHSNLSALYRIKIEANLNRGIPSDTIDCLLGTSSPQITCPVSSAIRADWVLTSNGRTVTQGATYGDYCCGGGGFYSKGIIGRQIGQLQTEKGRKYQLEVHFVQDGSALAAADPHLTIEEGGDYAETGSVIEGLLLLPCGTAFIAGLYFLGSYIFIAIRKSYAQAHVRA
jgi:hypothetical protein